MTVQFSRSVRSVQADNLGPMLIGAAFFAVLIFGWILWFFFATVPYFAESTEASYQREGYILANFPAATFPRLRRGQTAQFLLTTGDQTSSTIPLIVSDLYPETAQARLILRVSDQDAPRLQPGLTGQVKVTVERLTPARIVLRSAGLLSDS